ncbi:DNRLRE domain-containing protein [Nonomuraea sediminis]|uniref:DNRLRE domain-containing protein n=1 Tax=Nonomuraea sediminis TaxID=2835864 RepID=UPI001BDC7D29|nr:DNRLRE domain-containing protein [Nonomuraea sediminis]
MIVFVLVAALAPPPPASAQTLSIAASAEPRVISRFASWLGATVAGWFTDEPHGGMSASPVPVTLPGRDGAGATYKLDPVKEPGKRVKELTGQRTAVSKTFELEDGRRQVEISAAPERYRDARGDWQKIDTAVKQVDDGWGDDGTGFATRFSDGTDRLVRVGLGDAQLTFGLAGPAAKLTPEVDGSKVTYRNAFGPGADAVYEVTSSGVKEKIVLSQAPASGAAFAFTVTASGELQAKAQQDGSIAFLSQGSGKPVFLLPKPFMIDSADDAASPYGKRYSAAVRQEVTGQQGDQVTITVTPDAGWLADAGRAWPVTIDPTVVVSPDWNTSNDATIVSSAASTNFDGDGRLQVGVSGSSIARSLVQFNLASLVPSGTVIDKAELGLYYDQSLPATGVVPLEARQVTQAWDGQTVTWNSINTAIGPVAANVTYQPAEAHIWHSYPLTALVQGWVNGSIANHGVVIKAVNEGAAAGGPIYTAGDVLGGFPVMPMPKLTLTYGMPSVALARPRIVHATGAELSWSAYDGPGKVAEYQVHRMRTDQPFTPSAATLVATLEPTATFYVDTTAPPSAGATYQVVAVREDGQASTSGPQWVRTPTPGDAYAEVPASMDTTLSSCQPTQGHDTPGGLAELRAGFGGTTLGNTRALIKFDTSIIPASTKYLLAHVYFSTASAIGAEASYGFYELKRDFDEASASWQNAASGSAWTTPGGDYNAPQVGQPMWLAPGSPTWEQVDGFDAIAAKWVADPASNHGLLLRPTSESNKACPTSGNGATLTSSEAPESEVRPVLVVRYADPATTYQALATPPRMVAGEQQTIPVTVTNTTTTTWPAGTIKLGYFWKLPDGTDVTGASQILTPIPDELAPDHAVTVNATVKAPVLANGNLAEAVSLVWDSQDTTNNWQSASHGLPQLPQQIRIDSPTSDLLGLEKFYSYTGKNTGAGATALVNPYAGNLVWSYNAFSNPSRGAQTFVRMAYNSLDTSSASLGYGWSLQTSTLSKLGSQVYFHPPGQAWPSQVRLTDGDGTTHVWTLDTHGADVKDCTPATCDYTHPRGIHLYLQKTGSADPLRQWVFTKPDRTQFFFDDEGFQSAIVDKNGNTMSFTYERRRSNNKPTKFLQYITDAAGRRTLSLDYYAKGQDYTYINDAGQEVSDTKLTNPHIIDNVQTITDIAGRKVSFTYTDKGLLAKMVDGDGDAQAKTFRFSYDATQGNKNVKLKTVKDPRDHSTTFSYYEAPVDPKDKWKISDLTDRLQGRTHFDYVDPDGSQGSTINATVTDPLQHQTKYLLDASGRPHEITNAKNELTVLDWDSDHNVTTLTEPNQAKTTWEYDQQTGYPLTIKDAEANANGTPGTVLDYDTGLGGNTADLRFKTSPEGRKWEFRYDANGNLKSVTDPIGATTPDANDYTTKYDYDPLLGQLITSTDANGNATSYGDYDPTGYPKTITDPYSNVTATTYDVRGNVLTVTDALGKKTTQTYDIFKRPLENKSPKDQDAAQPVFIVTPAPIYDANDNVTTMAAPNGAISTATYDDADQLLSSILPVDKAGDPERKASFTWDLAGNLKTQTEPKGNLTPADPKDYVTTYLYDAIYQLTDVVNAKQDKISYSYDNVSNTTKVIDPRKNATADANDYTAIYGYDLNHRVKTVKDAAGYQTSTDYDLDGLVVGQTDQENNKSITVYDQRGAVVETRVPHAETDGVIKYVTTKFVYDQVGNQTKVITPRGVERGGDLVDFVQETKYDKLNRPSEKVFPYDRSDPVYNTPDSVLYAYDPVSRLQEISSPPSHGQSIRNVSSMTYWDNGWSKTTTDAWKIKTSYDYNELGEQTNRTVTSAGNSSQRALDWSYYPDGKLKTHSDNGVPLGLDVVLDDNSDTGQVSATGSWTTTSGGSLASNVVGPRVQTSATSGFVGYDYAVAPAGTGSSSFTWNLTIPADGSYKLYAQYPAGATATNAGYQVKHGATTDTVTVDQTKNSGDWVQLGTYTFTAGLGDTVTLTDNANGSVIADAVKLVRDNSGDTDGEKKDFAYTYDPNANLIDIADNSANAKIDNWDISYTGLNQIDTIKETLKGVLKNTTSYGYNENSAVTQLTHDKVLSTYRYDIRDLVDQVVNKKSASDPLPKTTGYTYTPRGEWLKETKANGNTVDYDYFLSGVLRYSVEKKPNAAIVAEHTIGYQGNLQRASDHAKLQNADNPGAYLENDYAYTYDPRDRIAKTVKTPVGGGAAETETYSHDPNSNVWQQQVLGKTTTFNFDRNRLMTSVTDGATSTYTYDPFGRLRTIQGGGKTQEKYTYDGFDHVIKHEKLGGDGATTVTSYTFDPLDRTTSKTEKEGSASAKTTNYSYLGLSSEVLDEEVAGQLTKSFQYSPWGERLSQTKITDTGAEESSYYGYNAHSDVEDITKENGDTRATYGYTAYGSNDDKLFTGIDKPDPVDPTAKDEYNPYRFNGKRWDNSTGMYDMGFRDYNPGLNRFLNLDSYNGALDDLGLGLDPWTANRYAFTGGNPINNIEIDGHAPDNCLYGYCSAQVAKDGPLQTGPQLAPTPNPSTPKSKADKSAEPQGTPTPSPRPGEDINSYFKACQKIGLENCRWGKSEVSLLYDLFVKDFVDCVGGDAGACAWAAVNIIPVGKIGKIGKLFKDAGKARELAEVAEDAAKAIKNCNSFDADTSVQMADGTRKRIEDVKIGDEVIATDPETGKTVARKITALHRNNDTAMADVVVEASSGRASTINTTQEHPFWSVTRNKWVNARELLRGEKLRTVSGDTVRVLAVRAFVRAQVMYNLTVDDIHTYYVLVGDQAILVHNSGPCKIPWSSGTVSRAAKAIDEGATSIHVQSRSQAEELFLGKFQGAGYRNATGFDGVGTKQYFGSKVGTYHWDDVIGADGRVVGHGINNADGALPHLQIHTFDGPIIRIFWGEK